MLYLFRSSRSVLLLALLAVLLPHAATAQTEQDEANRFVEYAERGNVRALDRALRNGISPDVRDESGRTALNTAIRSRSAEAFERLLASGADVNQTDGKGWTPLMVAANKGDAARVLDLIDADAAVQKTVAEGDRVGWSALTFAAFQYRVSVMGMLLDAGANPNGHKSSDRTLLGMVSQWANLSRRTVDVYLPVMEILLERGADPNARHDAEMPLLIEWITRRGRASVPAYMLLQHGARADVTYRETRTYSGRETRIQTPLGAALENRRVSLIPFLLEAGADPRKPVNLEGSLPLSRAADEAVDAPIIDQLIEAGAEVDARITSDSGTDGKTALMVAAEEGHTDVVLALLSRGADPNVRDDRARTPLIHAAFHFDEEERYTTVQALLAYGADATLRDENGDTVLDRVVEDRDEDERLASLLRTVIYDGDPPRGPSLPEDPSVDALMDAIRSSEHLKAKQLAEAEIGWTARIDSTVEDSRIARSMHGWSPFEVALGYHHPYTARMLMDVGMDPCEDEETQALALAIRIGDRALSERLLDAGCSADSRDEEGHWTPLLAATYADAEIIPRLLERGAVPAVKQSDADVLMHAAAFNNYVRAMRHLKEAGLDIEARAPNGETPLMAAVNGRAAYAAEWLLKNGASVDPSQSTGNRSSDERGVLSNAEKGLATYIVKKAGAVRWETVREVVASDSAFSAQIRREEARRGVTNARWEGSAYIDVDTAPSPPGGRDKFVASMPYPDILADAGIRGTVDAHFVVTKDGAVHAIHIMSSSHEALTREVLTGLRSAQFTPGTVDGNPVTSRISMTFSFPSE